MLADDSVRTDLDQAQRIEGRKIADHDASIELHVPGNLDPRRRPNAYARLNGRTKKPQQQISPAIHVVKGQAKQGRLHDHPSCPRKLFFGSPFAFVFARFVHCSGSPARHHNRCGRWRKPVSIADLPSASAAAQGR
jgi:hypothetical protein